VLQCVAVRCSALQCVAVRCSVLQAVRCSVLQCVAVRCSALQCGAVGCSVLQCVAAGCSGLQCVAMSTHTLFLRSCRHTLYLCLAHFSLAYFFYKKNTQPITTTHVAKRVAVLQHTLQHVLQCCSTHTLSLSALQHTLQHVLQYTHSISLCTATPFATRVAVLQYTHSLSLFKTHTHPLYLSLAHLLIRTHTHLSFSPSMGRERLCVIFQRKKKITHNNTQTHPLIRTHTHLLFSPSAEEKKTTSLSPQLREKKIVCLLLYITGSALAF